MNAENILIVTNRPTISDGWYNDYQQFVGRQGGYYFVSESDEVKGRALVISYEDYRGTVRDLSDDPHGAKIGLIYFVSLQDLKGSVCFGGKFDKLREVRNINWDLLIIDEAHEGVDTYKTDVAFSQIRRKFTLHLSGTPFKALANEKFAQDAIFNWTYADEQAKKRNWKGPGENPYAVLPTLNMFTYQMSEIVKDEISEGIEINGKTEEYAFDLGEFFKTKNGVFVHDASVDKFLHALATQEKYPFSTPKLRNELRHTFWFLDRVDSAKALAAKLKAHPVFKDYGIVLAAGDGGLDDARETDKSLLRVQNAIKKFERTITLSVGQLTTGVTVPEWTAVLMLSNIKSPSLYMQAAFRCQNPCLFEFGDEAFRKENAYVFDFDPARTLVVYEKFANDLKLAGFGEAQERRDNIKELLNFFPCIAEDENGEMIELDAEKVLSIPRRIKSTEVVRRGFMSNYLFQNISNVFRNFSEEVIGIIEKFDPARELAKRSAANISDARNISVDGNGNVVVDADLVIGTANNIFGDKIYRIIEEAVAPEIDSILLQSQDDIMLARDGISKLVEDDLICPIVDEVAKCNLESISKSDANKLNQSLTKSAEYKINCAFSEYSIRKNIIEQEREDAKSKNKPEAIINQEYEEKIAKISSQLQDTLKKTVREIAGEFQLEAVKSTETKKKEDEKSNIENSIRDHLKGFARTIPSFLMAYGDDNTTLETFDSIIPDKVFLDVTSISLEEFRFLRDGGDCEDSQTGETKHFNGNLFDPIVFNDSIREFMRLRRELSNYFDESNKEDIFDYIPPQRTNQIFTPKNIVERMVDSLEKENPGCFDNPEKTFIDLYMKSGLYIAEIVKRLYRSKHMSQLFPDRTERLKHIFEKQVFGLAPTEIIYRISLNFILGFEGSVAIGKHNLRQFDSLPSARDGTLGRALEDIFGKSE